MGEYNTISVKILVQIIQNRAYNYLSS